MKEKEIVTPNQIINGLKSALLKCEAFTPANVEGLEGLLDKVVKPEIQSAINEAVKAERERIIAKVPNYADINEYISLWNPDEEMMNAWIFRRFNQPQEDKP